MKPVTYWTAVLLLAAAAPGPARAQDGRYFKVYPLVFVEPATAEAAAGTIVEEGGRVLLDRGNRRLLVRATEAEHGELAALLKQLNVPPKNVRIEVAFTGVSAERERGASLGARGGVTVTPGGTSGRIAFAPSVVDGSTRRRDRTVQELLVSSGRAGSLEVGEQVPYVEWLMSYGARWGVVEQRVRWQQVGAFLNVEATVLGDGPNILVRLTPELRGRVDNNPYRVSYTRAATEVTVASGTTVRLGGLSRDTEFYRRFLVGLDRAGAQHTMDIQFTPRIEAPGVPIPVPGP